MKFVHVFSVARRSTPSYTHRTAPRLLFRPRSSASPAASNRLPTGQRPCEGGRPRPHRGVPRPRRRRGSQGVPRRLRRRPLKTPAAAPSPPPTPAATRGGSRRCCPEPLRRRRLAFSPSAARPPGHPHRRAPRRGRPRRCGCPSWSTRSSPRTWPAGRTSARGSCSSVRAAPLPSASRPAARVAAILRQRCSRTLTAAAPSPRGPADAANVAQHFFTTAFLRRCCSEEVQSRRAGERGATPSFPTREAAPSPDRRRRPPAPAQARVPQGREEGAPRVRGRVRHCQPPGAQRPQI